MTSPNHIRRGAADFGGATGLRVVGTLTTATDLSKYLTPLTKDQTRGNPTRGHANRANPPRHPRTGCAPAEPARSRPPGLLADIGGQILEQLLDAGSSN